MKRIYVRAFLGRLKPKGPHVAEFECAAGHVWKAPLLSKKFAQQRLGDFGAATMAKYWSKESGGCTGTCPKCAKDYDMDGPW